MMCILLILLSLLIPGCYGSEEVSEEGVKEVTVALIKTDFGEIAIELFDADAPKTVANFIKLAKQKFYDKLVFHRVVKGLLIQTGCPKGDGTGGPGWTIPLERTQHKHIPGAVVMWHRPSDENSAGSQFYICLSRLPERDERYCVFGQVIRGMSVVHRIENVEVEQYFIGGVPFHRPKKPVRILSVRIVKERKVR